MKQLARTSRGWVELDVERLPMGGDVTVRAAVFHNDGGWATAEQTWNKWSTESVESFLSDVADIPAEEAAQTVAKALDEWRARGGEIEARGDKRKLVSWLAAVFGFAAVGVLAVVALIVILLIRLA